MSHPDPTRTYEEDEENLRKRRGQIHKAPSEVGRPTDLNSKGHGQKAVSVNRRTPYEKMMTNKSFKHRKEEFMNSKPLWDRSAERMRYDQLPLTEKVTLGLRMVHDEFSGHVGKEQEHKDCEHCLANVKAQE